MAVSSLGARLCAGNSLEAIGKVEGSRTLATAGGEFNGTEIVCAGDTFLRHPDAEA